MVARIKIFNSYEKEAVMALMKCTECGKEISTRASSCPGCGCPVGVHNSKSQHIDFSKYSKEELFQKANDIQWKGGKDDLPLVAEMFEYVITKFSGTKEAEWSKNHMENIDVALNRNQIQISSNNCKANVPKNRCDSSVRQYEAEECGDSSHSSISAKKEDSGIGQVLYVISGSVMFIYYFIQGVNEHGAILGSCLFPWYMIKGVLWPLFVLISWY